MREQRPFNCGDHVCVVYETAEEQLETAAAYVADGLRRRERCLYAADSPAALDRFRASLEALGIDAGEAERTGALLAVTSDTVHLEGGRFDSERMLGLLNDAVEEALNEGFKGLRTCGDMSWLLQDAPGSSQVVVYEALLNQFFGSVRAIGMCQYDRRRLPEGLLDSALSTHTSVVIDGRHRDNPYYRPWPFDPTAAPDVSVDDKVRQLQQSGA